MSSHSHADAYRYPPSPPALLPVTIALRAAQIDPPPDVLEMLAALLARLRVVLGDNLVGVYLRGSLVMGDFDPATSDLDFFAVTERPVSHAEFTALAAMHAALDALPHRYARQLEGPYVERSAAWRYQPGQRHPGIARNEALAEFEPGANWVLERWVVRERGVTLLGPDPTTLIAPVARAELRAAVRSRLPDWVAFAATPEDPEWREPHRSHLAYFVETMCRALYTLSRGELASKPCSVAWALATLPEPWRSLVERSRAWHGDETVDISAAPEVQCFIRWTAAQG